MTTRGCRNNNPGNIRLAPGTRWLGQVPKEEQTDPEFVQFAEMHWGLRAMCRVLRTYMLLHGLRTVRGMIGRWAPPQENDTESYVAYVARRAGVDPDRPLDPGRDRAALLRMVRAMIEMESGQECAAEIGDAQIEAAAVDAGFVKPALVGDRTDGATVRDAGGSSGSAPRTARRKDRGGLLGRLLAVIAAILPRR